MEHPNTNQNNCIECRLCKIISKLPREREIQDTLLYETEHFQCIPGLGSFIEGYSLIVSKSHALNTGCFPSKIIKELENLILKVKETLKDIYKKHSVVFEHGSMGNQNHAGSCIDHHHIHIFPIEISEVPPVLTKNFVNHSSIDSMNRLKYFNREKIPYIYYMSNSGCHYVFEAPILPRQYVRQILAAECGQPQNWDWREKPFLENIYSYVREIRRRKK